MQWYTYILECSDGSFYVGYTEDIQQRVAMHNAGKGAIFTKHRCPVKLVYSESHTSKVDAVARELQLKKWSRAKKQALVEDNLAKLRDLARRRTPS